MFKMISVKYKDDIVEILKINVSNLIVNYKNQKTIINKDEIKIIGLLPTDYTKIYEVPMIVNLNELVKVIINEYKSHENLKGLRSSIMILYTTLSDLYHIKYENLKSQIKKKGLDYYRFIKKLLTFSNIYVEKRHFIYIFTYLKKLDNSLSIRKDLIDDYVVYDLDHSIIIWIYIFEKF